MRCSHGFWNQLQDHGTYKADVKSNEIPLKWNGKLGEKFEAPL